MNVLSALEAIEAAPQGNARLDAIRQNDSPQLRWVLTQALSPDITFGIKKLPAEREINEHTVSRYRTEEAWFHDLGRLCDELANRTKTGNVAKVFAARVLAHCTPLQRKWTERVLKQDLRINVGAKDVNNALGEGTIYLFEVPLAVDFRKASPKDLAGRWAIQPKLDGGRCVAVLPANGGRVRLLSRTGKEWGNFESVRRELQKYNEKVNAKNTWYIDGEVVSFMNGRIEFQAIQKTMMRKDGVEVGELKFMVFDAATEQEWKSPSETYEERWRVARSTVWTAHLHDVPEQKLELVEADFTDRLTVPMLEEICNMYTEAGYEGAMARRADIPVENRRTKKLLKLKTFLDDEAEVVAVVEGAGKYEGMLGALKCRHKNGQLFEIGSGFDDSQRREFWDAKGLPRHLTFKYQNLTDDGVPRFPIFSYFRHEADIG
jgi:DNA ligase-1